MHFASKGLQLLVSIHAEVGVVLLLYDQIYSEVVETHVLSASRLACSSTSYTDFTEPKHKVEVSPSAEQCTCKGTTRRICGALAMVLRCVVVDCGGVTHPDSGLKEVLGWDERGAIGVKPQPMLPHIYLCR